MWSVFSSFATDLLFIKSSIVSTLPWFISTEAFIYVSLLTSSPSAGVSIVTSIFVGNSPRRASLTALYASTIPQPYSVLYLFERFLS